jgi:hypothetical protein
MEALTIAVRYVFATVAPVAVYIIHLLNYLKIFQKLLFTIQSLRLRLFIKYIFPSGNRRSYKIFQ